MEHQSAEDEQGDNHCLQHQPNEHTEVLQRFELLSDRHFDVDCKQTDLLSDALTALTNVRDYLVSVSVAVDTDSVGNVDCGLSRDFSQSEST